tara:strand:+ start:387 stop:929 length:543 start_codon:yes stop_codon:yes gene_type:complete
MKLHLGCGERYLEGYIHVDIADFDHIDYRSSVDKLDMFEDDSCELIYASHVLEYFDIEEAINVLSEWHRVLENKGTLRLAVPNIEKLIEVYKKTDDLNRILGPLYGKWEIGNAKDYIYHKNVYDIKSLTSLLTEVGYKDIRPWAWNEILPEEYDDHSKAYYPHMDFDNGIHVSLNIECSK